MQITGFTQHVCVGGKRQMAVDAYMQAGQADAGRITEVNGRPVREVAWWGPSYRWTSYGRERFERFLFQWGR